MHPSIILHSHTIRLARDVLLYFDRFTQITASLSGTPTQCSIGIGRYTLTSIKQAVHKMPL